MAAFIENGLYYRLSEKDHAELAAYLDLNDPQVDLLENFVLNEIDGYYYAFTDEVDTNEMRDIILAGLDLDMWMYLKSNQWVRQ